MSEQLTLDLPHRATLGREDFLVTDSNAAAVALIDQWPNWPSYGAVIVGPPGSGKSHLVEVWRQKSGAQFCTSETLTIEGVPTLLGTSHCAIEITISMAERAIFHALNYARQEGHNLLFTSAEPISEWKITIPDLASRLKALPTVMIGQPDDALLRGVLVKLFLDRQIAVDETTLNYMLLRMPRSLQSARSIVAQIDQQAMAEKAEITRHFVARVLTGFTSPDLFEENN
jgi:chromosomal replication initiation ATPase DnaA